MTAPAAMQTSTAISTAPNAVTDWFTTCARARTSSTCAASATKPDNADKAIVSPDGQFPIRAVLRARVQRRGRPAQEQRPERREDRQPDADRVGGADADHRRPPPRDDGDAADGTTQVGGVEPRDDASDLARRRHGGRRHQRQRRAIGRGGREGHQERHAEAGGVEHPRRRGIVDQPEPGGSGVEQHRRRQRRERGHHLRTCIQTQRGTARAQAGAEPGPDGAAGKDRRHRGGGRGRRRPEPVLEPAHPHGFHDERPRTREREDDDERQRARHACGRCTPFHVDVPNPTPDLPLTAPFDRPGS